MNNLLNDVIQQAMNMAEQRKGEALLLFGESHDPIPRTLIRDPDLPANAKLIWCHLRSVTGDPTRPDMAPRYADLMRDLSIGSRQTVAHCYHALRLTRWITLVTRRVDRFGYTVGNVYGLHTTPATIPADAGTRCLVSRFPAAPVRPDGSSPRRAALAGQTDTGSRDGSDRQAG